jgi:3-hydroxybutyrate dehydrogenase
MTKPDQIAAMVARPRRTSAGSISSSTMPASSMSRRSTNSRSRNGTDHRDQPVLGLPHHRAAPAEDEGEGLGPDHQHGLGAHAFVASPFKSAYVAAKHGIAGLTKTVALEVAPTGITVNCDRARLCLDAAGREADPRHDEGARPDQASR